ncbi:MAG: hypothetical protein SGILL_000214, partial [Bacillariaceae sp.]
ALSCAQVVVRLTENLLILFRYGRRDASTVRLADFFEFVLDGVFLAWMVYNLYNVTQQISRDFGGRMVWSWANKLVHFWILYSMFVFISGIQSVVGILHYVVNAVALTEHYQFTFYKINAVSDIALLTGIAILLRPVHQSSPYSLVEDGNLDGHAMGGSTVEGETTDYALLLPDQGSRESESHDDGDDALASMEMISHAPEVVVAGVSDP